MGFRSGKAKGPWVGTNNGGGTAANPTNVPTWFMCIPFDYTMFTPFAALAGDVEIWSMPAMGFIEGYRIKTSTAFAGPGITALTLSGGLVGNLAKYCSPFDALSAVSNTNEGSGHGYSYVENYGAVTSIRLAALATGANLSVLTQGEGCIFIKGGKLLP